MNTHHSVVCHKSIRKGQNVKGPVGSKSRRNNKSQSISGSEARQAHRQEAIRRTVMNKAKEGGRPQRTRTAGEQSFLQAETSQP